jgi:hypothetical protein
MGIFSLVLLTINVSQSVPPASPGQIFDCPPRDEAVQDPDLVAFRASLLQSIARRDASALLKAASPEIRTSFGDDDGLAGFERDLRSRRGQLWTELGTVLKLGGAFEVPEMFVAPFSWGCGGLGDVVVMGRQVRVRSRGDIAAPVMALVSFAILQRGDAQAPRGWEPVRLPDGRNGFIAERFVRSAVGYRAYFTKADGRWRLAAFIAGN